MTTQVLAWSIYVLFSNNEMLQIVEITPKVTLPSEYYANHPQTNPQSENLLNCVTVFGFNRVLFWQGWQKGVPIKRLCAAMCKTTENVRNRRRTPEDSTVSPESLKARNDFLGSLQYFNPLPQCRDHDLRYASSRVGSVNPPYWM